MTLWLNRAGGDHEREARCLADNRIYLGWGLNYDLRIVSSKLALSELLRKAHPDRETAASAGARGQMGLRA